MNARRRADGPGRQLPAGRPGGRRLLARRLALLAAAGLLALAACSNPSPTDAPAAGSELRSQALIDSGNTAFRTGDFASAAKRYASAAVLRPDDPAAYYGLGMALAKLGRDDDARVAYARARALATAGGGKPPGR